MDLLIVYTDGVEKIIENVEEYELLRDARCFKYTKGRKNSFLPCENVKYFGRRENYVEV